MICVNLLQIYTKSIVILYILGFLALRAEDGSGFIWLVAIAGASGAIFTGLVIGFMGDELEGDIVIKGNTVLSTVKTPGYLKRRMIVCFIDAVTCCFSGIINVYISFSALNLGAFILSIIVSVIFLLVALASKGDKKKMNNQR